MRDDEPVRILLVEDNTADVYLFRKALLGAELNFDLTVIEDGGRAISFARDEGEYAGSPVPDLFVLDLSLPKNDGIQVLEAIRAKKRFANVPVVTLILPCKEKRDCNSGEHLAMQLKRCKTSCQRSSNSLLLQALKRLGEFIG